MSTYLKIHICSGTRGTNDFLRRNENRSDCVCVCVKWLGWARKQNQRDTVFLRRTVVTGGGNEKRIEQLVGVGGPAHSLGAVH